MATVRLTGAQAAALAVLLESSASDVEDTEYNRVAEDLYATLYAAGQERQPVSIDVYAAHLVFGGASDYDDGTWPPRMLRSIETALDKITAAT